MILLAQTTDPQSTLDNVATVVEMVGTSVTAIAVVVGAIWAYYKFVKGRTYRPRLEVKLSGEWRPSNGQLFLHTRVTVKNIGASVVTLLQEGTWLRISSLAEQQDGDSMYAAWNEVGTFEVLDQHRWIEPGETVSDDLLLTWASERPVMTLLEPRLVWQWSGGNHNIDVSARQVLPIDSRMDGSTADVDFSTGKRGE